MVFTIKEYNIIDGIIIFLFLAYLFVKSWSGYRFCYLGVSEGGKDWDIDNDEIVDGVVGVERTFCYYGLLKSIGLSISSEWWWLVISSSDILLGEDKLFIQSTSEYYIIRPLCINIW